MWPRLATYFGASASSDQKFHKEFYVKGDVQLELSIAEWSKEREAWKRICDRAGKPGVKATFAAGTWAFQD
jgi:hypothetical protein